jgi:hypothetical protein
VIGDPETVIVELSDEDSSFSSGKFDKNDLKMKGMKRAPTVTINRRNT